MNEFVHFAVGVSCGLFVLGFLDISARREFLLIFASGVWAMVPDGYWVLAELGVTRTVESWQAFHRSGAANVFWFHRVLDRHETGKPKLEAIVALALMLTMVIYYYFVNNWR